MTTYSHIADRIIVTTGMTHGTKPIKDARCSALLNRTISSIFTIKVTAVIIPMPSTELNRRMDLANGIFRDISLMARGSSTTSSSNG